MKSLTSLSKSFVPILLVLLTIYLVLLNVHFKALSSAERITVIQISNAVSDEEVSEDIDTDDELEAYLDDTYLRGTELLGLRQLEQVLDIVDDLNTQGKADLAKLLEGRLALFKGQNTRALQLFNETIELGNAPVSTYFFRARVHRQLGNDQSAIDDYDQVLKINPNHFSANYNRALLWYGLDNFAAAARGFQKASTLSGGERKARSFSKLAKSLLNQNLPEPAKLAALEALRFAPGLIEARMTLASIHLENNNNDEALAEYDRVKSLGPTNASTFATLARFYLKNNRLQSSEHMYRQAIQHRPKSRKLRTELTLMMVDQQRWGEAADQCQSIIQHYPEDIDTHFLLGRIEHAQGNYLQSIAHYQRVIDIKQGQSPESWFNIGLVQHSAKDYQSALKSYRQATEADPGYYEAWYNMALVSLKLDDYNAAKQQLETAVSIKPGYSKAWYNLGIVHAEQQNEQLAIEAYQKAVDINPDYHAAKLNLAVRYSKVEDYLSAEELYREVLELRPHYKSAWYNLGLALINQDELDEAIPVFEKVIELDANHHRSYNHLADIYYSRKEYETVKGYLKRTLDIKPENIKARYLLAKTLYRQKSYDEALKAANQVLALRPESKNTERLIKRINKKIKSLASR